MESRRPNQGHRDRAWRATDGGGGGSAFRRREASGRVVPGARLPTGSAAVGRADQPPRLRVDPLAGGLSNRFFRSRDFRHARPLFSRPYRHADHRTRPGPGVFPSGKLHDLSGDEGAAPADRRTNRAAPPAVPAGGTRVGAVGSEGARHQVAAPVGEILRGGRDRSAAGRARDGPAVAATARSRQCGGGVGERGSEHRFGGQSALAVPSSNRITAARTMHGHRRPQWRGQNDLAQGVPRRTGAHRGHRGGGQAGEGELHRPNPDGA